MPSLAPPPLPEQRTHEPASVGRTDSDQLIRKTARGGGIAFAGNVLDKGIRFPLEILLARVLGAGDYGAYALGYGLAIIGSELSMLGLRSGVVRFGALYQGTGDLERVKGTLRSAFAIATLSSVLAGGVLFVLAKTISDVFDMPGLVNVLRVFAFAFPFYVVTLMAGQAALAFHAVTVQVVVTNICRPLAHVILVATLFLLGFGLLGAVSGFLASCAISAAIGLHLLRRVRPDMASRVRPTYEIGKLMRFSLPVLFVGVSYALLGQTDRIMLGYFKASSDLGIYSAAAVISQQAGVITYSFGTIFSPIISDLYHRNESDDLDRLYKTVTRWIVSLNLLILLLIILFARQIMGVFGTEFVAGWPVLVLLSLVSLIGYSVGGALVGFMLRMSGKQDIELANAAVMLLANIVLNLWLIPRYGILGAALATGFSFSLINAARIVEVYKLLRMHPFGTNYHKPFIAGAAVVLMFVLLYATGVMTPYWIACMVVLCVLYVGVLYLLGAEPEDKIVWEAIRRRVRNRQDPESVCP